MAGKMKGIYKSFKYITQIFVVKERDMEIGYPTDVKHVAHIGWDGPSGNGPSWMKDFETATDFSTSLGNLGGLRDPNPMAVSTSWSSQGAPHVPKKPKQKKVKSTSSSESLSASSRQSRAAKSKAAYSVREATPIAQV